MKWTVGLKIGAGYGLALGLLITVGVISYRSTVELMDRSLLVEKTQSEIILLEDIRVSITDSESSVRGYLLTGDPSYLDLHTGAKTTVAERIAELKLRMAGNAELLNKLYTLESIAQQKLDVMSGYVLTYDTQGPLEESSALKLEVGTDIMDQCRKAITDIATNLSQKMMVRQAQADISAKRVLLTITVGIPISVLLISIASFFIIRDITRPLRETTELANRIAAGDLSNNPLYINRQDEIGVLSRAFEAMTSSLREITHELLSGISIISSASSEIMASTAQVASTAMETSVAISQTTSSVEEVKQSAIMASEKARAVSDATHGAVQSSESGLKSVELSIGGMNRIQGQVETISQSLMRLSEQSQAVGEIIASVNDLAEQSNLLAVNAAIEAAKAGEQGKGFAVVAQEVKLLAEQSKEATAQVRKILNDILKAINGAVLATEQGNKAVSAGTVQAREAGDMIRTMVDGIGDTAQMALQIAITSQQQLIGMDQISMAMENIRQASEQNVSGVKQVEFSIRNLHDLGQRLKATVGKYSL